MRRSLRARLASALTALRTQGPLVSAEKAATAVGWRRLLLLVADVAETPLARPAKVPVELRFLDASELDLFLASQPELDRAHAERHLASGRTCLVALHDGRVAGSSWIARDAIVSEWGRVRRPLAHDEAYIFAAHTAVAYRGQGINFVINAHLHSWLRDQGVRRAYRMTIPWNEPALAAHRKAGYRTCGQFVALGYGRFGPSFFIAASG